MRCSRAAASVHAPVVRVRALLDPARERARLANLPPRGETAVGLRAADRCQFRTRCPAALSTCAARSPEPEEAGNARRVACLRWRELVNEP